MTFPKECLIDTNVPKIANLTVAVDLGVPTECIFACVQAIEEVTKNGGLIIDEGGEIFNEYLRQLSIRGQPGVGDRFMKWVHDNSWTPSAVQRVAITKKGDSYEEFPVHEGLSNFDISDRKFIAAANAHGKKPPILQAADSKWVGWKNALSEAGITIQFLCPKYVEKKYTEKMER